MTLWDVCFDLTLHTSRPHALPLAPGVSFPRSWDFFWLLPSVWSGFLMTEQFPQKQILWGPLDGALWFLLPKACIFIFYFLLLLGVQNNAIVTLFTPHKVTTLFPQSTASYTSYISVKIPLMPVPTNFLNSNRKDTDFSKRRC